jgi:hypothetical protein
MLTLHKQLSSFFVLFICSAAWGQVTQPSTGTQPSKIDEAFTAQVITVSGNVSYALLDEKGAPGQWKEAKVGDRLPAGSWIRTQIRSKVGLAFGDDTVVVVDRATLASIDQFHRTGDTKHVRLGLGHGTVRGGVAETTLRSDMTIETPTATLSKRGTIDFGISYEPSTNRFRVYLGGPGLVEALNKLTNDSQLVRPGQYVTQAMIRWIETATFDRWVPVVDTFGMSNAEKMFNAMNDSGTAVVDPGGGANIYGIGGRNAGQTLSNNTFNMSPPTPGSTVIPRPEGNFGTGLGQQSSQFKRSR